RSRWGFGALICGVLAVHARAPIGFFALSLLGMSVAAVLLRVCRRGPVAVADPTVATDARWSEVAIGLLAIVGVASFNGVSYLKFKTIAGCPLRYNVSY